MALPSSDVGQKRNGSRFDSLNLKKRHIGQASAVLIFVGLAFWGTAGLFSRSHYIYEYDARISGKLITVSSRISGWVTRLMIIQGSKIKQNQALAQIDERISHLKIQHYDIQLRGIEAEKTRLAAERKLVQMQTSSKYQSQFAQWNATKAWVAAQSAQLDLARTEYARIQSLLEKKVISKQEFDKAWARMTQLEGEYRKAQAEQNSAQARLEEAKAERARLDVLDGQLEVLEIRAKEYKILQKQQMLDLQDRTIRSRIDGIVDETFVEEGEYLVAGQRLALIHDPADIWVEANIKETEIAEIKVGHPVTISVDAYPDRVFTGQVTSIGTSTTGEFALLPNPNPSGNFTKITQRIPVHISIQQHDDLLRPGMLVEVEIKVSAP